MMIRSPELFVNAIHDELGYQKIREALSRQYNLSNLDPDIQVYSVDLQGDRSLTLRYTQQNRVPLAETTHEVLKHLYYLWKFPVNLHAVDTGGNVTAEFNCPALATNKENITKAE